MNVFLHIGGDFSVRVGEILSIYDYDAMKASEAGRAFLRKRERTLVDISDGRPKSAVVTDRNIYLSALSPGTLKKRAEEREKAFDIVWE